ncbi:unnamed protein product [Brugia pahangi]|uniref:Transposase n=1 Tax=Brugia pahangi TaxID=6280 RepID=A0A0N4T526_BRUPA|nr:unnamed protein product [Brugia pahangi]
MTLISRYINQATNASVLTDEAVGYAVFFAFVKDLASKKIAMKFLACEE